MYKVYRDNRVATKQSFMNYEAARQFVRKLLRKETDLRISGQPYLVDYDTGTRGYHMSNFGFKIKRVQ